ncbi:MAG: hypothetical protein JWP89_5339 [Schlesneria sp.]|nr:hypothetical protein [Schlesneria sp.]
MPACGDKSDLVQVGGSRGPIACRDFDPLEHVNVTSLRRELGDRMTECSDNADYS